MVWPFCRNDSAVMGLLQKKNNNENTQQKNTSCRLSFAIVTIYLIALPLQHTLLQYSPSSNFFILCFAQNRFYCMLPVLDSPESALLH